MRDLIRYIQESSPDTRLRATDLAKQIELSTREIRRYLSDLEKLNLITRSSDGAITLNMHYVNYIEDSLGYEPAQ